MNGESLIDVSLLIYASWPRLMNGESLRAMTFCLIDVIGANDLKHEMRRSEVKSVHLTPTNQSVVIFLQQVLVVLEMKELSVKTAAKRQS